MFHNSKTACWKSKKEKWLAYVLKRENCKLNLNKIMVQQVLSCVLLVLLLFFICNQPTK